MTEERYNQLTKMSDAEIADVEMVSDEEYREYRRRRYLELTDHDAGVGELM